MLFYFTVLIYIHKGMSYVRFNRGVSGESQMLLYIMFKSIILMCKSISARIASSLKFH